MSASQPVFVIIGQLWNDRKLDDIVENVRVKFKTTFFNRHDLILRKKQVYLNWLFQLSLDTSWCDLSYLRENTDGFIFVMLRPIRGDEQ